MESKRKTREPIQTSETFRLCAILTLSGGFQDAYTYNIRDKVFSNAQTGNVVLMSQHFMEGDWLRGVHYLAPLVAFALGILASEIIGRHFRPSRKIHWRQIVVLVEVAILFLVGLIPTRYNMAATMAVSFACAMQVQAFRKLHGYSYASTMCIGNLRSGVESLAAFYWSRERGALHKAGHYFGIILIFALGAGAGGVCSGLLGLRAIWVSCALLLAGCLLMGKEKL